MLTIVDTSPKSSSDDDEKVSEDASLEVANLWYNLCYVNLFCFFYCAILHTSSIPCKLWLPFNAQVVILYYADRVKSYKLSLVLLGQDPLKFSYWTCFNMRILMILFLISNTGMYIF